ncbi:hypothetical protein C4N9_20745 [Pararhodobacter marinus]|uniref:Uncharacterized protein n=1 Tax=Pararhodobacter marinus TaxID=2184063 RepID=A0A2U2C4A4_9RHOB|nr:hypothetical protein [Pararhodobacter marinus]PWE26692.1 hypothetical protein C4N9_20745 [Pararhodobacter marinus]
MSDYRARVIGPATVRILANNLPDLAEGETVFVSIERVRSENSHKHQFAWVKDAWASLPEAEAFQPWAETPETLRKHALIATGFHRLYTLDCGSNAAAQRVRAELIRAETKAEGYAVGQVIGPVVRIWTPESQSYRAMGKARFQESKEAILGWIAAKIGVAPEELKRNAA